MSTVGGRLRAARRHARLSIGDLAGHAGVSAGMISQVERNLSNPSLRLLEKLREALGISLSELLEAPAARSGPIEQDFVRRADARPSFTVGPAPLTKHMLSPRVVGHLMFMSIDFPALACSEEMVVVAGEKAGLVLSGRFRLIVDDIEVVLSQGDSFQFDSAKPHRIYNDLPETSSLLWIMAQSTPIHQL